MKVTVPVGVPLPEPEAATVAVNRTDWPKTDGFGPETTVVVLLALLTVWVNVEEVLLLKLVSPP